MCRQIKINLVCTLYTSGQEKTVVILDFVAKPHVIKSDVHCTTFAQLKGTTLTMCVKYESNINSYTILQLRTYSSGSRRGYIPPPTRLLYSISVDLFILISLFGTIVPNSKYNFDLSHINRTQPKNYDHNKHPKRPSQDRKFTNIL